VFVGAEIETAIGCMLKQNVKKKSGTKILELGKYCPNLHNEELDL
jgi:hypothetical protein